ncbi:MAG: hypothetical protein OES09_01960 [Gammaproteobacteria bacterium]|nr:hypothetical protein [Gammaproteobacteria bacterium]
MDEISYHSDINSNDRLLDALRQTDTSLYTLWVADLEARQITGLSPTGKAERIFNRLPSE